MSQNNPYFAWPHDEIRARYRRYTSAWLILCDRMHLATLVHSVKGATSFVTREDLVLFGKLSDAVDRVQRLRAQMRAALYA